MRRRKPRGAARGEFAWRCAAVYAQLMGLRTIAALIFTAAAAGQQIEVCPPVPVYEPCEIAFEMTEAEASAHPNPYTDVTLRAEFRSPKGGRTKVMQGFWDGDRRFRLRFAPDFEGRWDFRIISNLAGVDRKTGSFDAAPQRLPGFVEVFNTRYFKHANSLTPHYWLGDTMLHFSLAPWETFRRIVDARVEQKFTHVRGLALGPDGNEANAFRSPDEPNPAYFREMDRRIDYMTMNGLTVDLILGGGGGRLIELFPTRRQRDLYIRYIAARYAAFNVTWQGLLEWESYADGRGLLKEIAAALDKYDPYGHPKTTAAAVSSAALSYDGWQDFMTQNTVDAALAAIEFETQPAPFVNTRVGVEGGGASAGEIRRRAWTAAVRGQYATYAHAGTAGIGGRAADAKFVDAEGAWQMTLLADFFAQTRYFDLLPHYRVVGGAGLALQLVPYRAEEPIGVEYIVYAEKPGTIELAMPRHEYKVSWYNPIDGSWIDEKKKFKGSRFTAQTPNDEHDWVLYVRREGKKQGYNKSFKLESKRVKLREVETNPAELPFAIQFPAESELTAGREHEFNATLTKSTIAAKRMLWLWTAESAGSGRGRRILGTRQFGSFTIPADIAKSYPATLSVRLFGIDGAGRLFEGFKAYKVSAPPKP